VEELVIPDAGHWLMEEQPAATVAAVRLPRPEELTVSLAARVVGGEGHTSIAQTRSSDLECVALSKGSAPRASGAKRIGHRKGRLGPSAPIPCIRYVSRPNLSTEQRGLAEPKGGPP
jgi:hypothetical protein